VGVLHVIKCEVKLVENKLQRSPEAPAEAFARVQYWGTGRHQ
jgi:hypothetical protein